MTARVCGVLVVLAVLSLAAPVSAKHYSNPHTNNTATAQCQDDERVLALASSKLPIVYGAMCGAKREKTVDGSIVPDCHVSEVPSPDNNCPPNRHEPQNPTTTRARPICLSLPCDPDCGQAFTCFLECPCANDVCDDGPCPHGAMCVLGYLATENHGVCMYPVDERAVSVPLRPRCVGKGGACGVDEDGCCDGLECGAGAQDAALGVCV